MNQLKQTCVKIAFRPGEKRYLALLPGGRISQRTFDTATQAEAYCARWKKRYAGMKGKTA